MKTWILMLAAGALFGTGIGLGKLFLESQVLNAVGDCCTAVAVMFGAVVLGEVLAPIVGRLGAR